MSQFARRLRTPEERVGMLPNASLPPPAATPTACAEDALLGGAAGECEDRHRPANPPVMIW